MEIIKPYTYDDYMQDLKSEPLGRCVICGEDTCDQFRDKNGGWIFLCDYPDKCKLEAHERRMLY